jgi:hypothetical protein
MTRDNRASTDDARRRRRLAARLANSSGFGITEARTSLCRAVLPRATTPTLKIWAILPVPAFGGGYMNPRLLSRRALSRWPRIDLGPPNSQCGDRLVGQLPRSADMLGLMLSLANLAKIPGQDPWPRSLAKIPGQDRRDRSGLPPPHRDLRCRSHHAKRAGMVAGRERRPPNSAYARYPAFGPARWLARRLVHQFPRAPRLQGLTVNYEVIARSSWIVLGVRAPVDAGALPNCKQLQAARHWTSPPEPSLRPRRLSSLTRPAARRWRNGLHGG